MQVDVSLDGGRSWEAAELDDDEALGRWAWRRWTYRWEAGEGEHWLGSRAADDAGYVQPLDPAWNVGGYANNAVQWVDVTVV